MHALRRCFLTKAAYRKKREKKNCDIIYAYYIIAFHNSLNQIIWTIHSGWQGIITSDNVRL